MSYTVTAIDRTALATALLNLAKAQMRVIFTRDDAYITDLLAQAIDDIERQANTTLFERTIELVPEGCWTPWWQADWPAPPSDSAYFALPFTNVSELVVTDATGADVSAGYAVQQVDPGGASAAVLVTPIPFPGTGTLFVFTAGVSDPTLLAPSVRRAILRRCAALYENREAPLTIAEPLDAGDPLVWRPSA